MKEVNNHALLFDGEIYNCTECPPYNWFVTNLKRFELNNRDPKGTVFFNPYSNNVRWNIFDKIRSVIQIAGVNVDSMIEALKEIDECVAYYFKRANDNFYSDIFSEYKMFLPIGADTPKSMPYSCEND